MIHPFDWGALMAAALRGEMRALMLGETPRGVAEMINPDGFGPDGFGFVYLATPYSKRAVDRHGVWSLRESGRLADEAAKEVARLKLAGVSAFSPIALSSAVVHATLNPFSIKTRPDPRHDPLDAACWLTWCMPFLRAARALVVPDLPGWDQSNGIKAEVTEALRLGMPVMLYAEGAVHAF